jgi:GR25 family glycosyltransferase involved in LPS biosynthesis
MLNKKIKTYVINLDKRPDRLSELNLPLEWERFSATDGEQYQNTPQKEKGWRGCHNSHTRLMEMIVNSSDADLYLIFEDDVEVCGDFIIKMEEIINSLPYDWELLFLGGWNVGDKIRYNEFVNLAKKVYCMHAYIIKPQIANKLLNKFNERIYKIDILLAELLPELNAYICNPTIAWQRPGFSNIENKETNNKHLK